MSGVLGSVLASSSGTSYTVTVASTGTGRGFVSGSAGAVSPTSLLGAPIRIIQAQASPSQFTFELDSLQAQGFFREIVAQDSGGTYRRFFSSAAVFSQPGGARARWAWSTAADGSAGEIWAGFSGDRTVLIYF